MIKIKYWVIFVSSVSIFPYSLYAEYPWQFSLLYSQAECDVIQHTRQKLQNQQTNDHLLHLSGIAYIDDQHWSLWLNDRVIDINHPYDGIEIIQVTSDSIVFKINKAGSLASYTLRINQSININAVIHTEQ